MWNYTSVSKKIQNEAKSPNTSSEIIPVPNMNIKFENEYPMHLQAIAILTTSVEINDGRFSSFCDNLIRVTENVNDLDLIITINNEFHKKIIDIDNLKYIFREVIILNVNIPSKKDVYLKNISKYDEIPEFGTASGPNILFFETMKYCEKYNTILLLETDCILYKGWDIKSKHYINNNECFLISGSTYEGIGGFLSSDITFLLHINGVAFYKTCSPIFQFIIGCLRDYITSRKDKLLSTSAYDFILTKMILEYLRTAKTMEVYIFWKTVFRNIVKNSLIINVSTMYDTNTPESYFLNIYKKCVILHKKT